MSGHARVRTLVMHRLRSARDFMARTVSGAGTLLKHATTLLRNACPEKRSSIQGKGSGKGEEAHVVRGIRSNPSEPPRNQARTDNRRCRQRHWVLHPSPARGLKGNGRLVGIDRNERLIEVGKKLAKVENLSETVSFRKGDANSIPVADGTADRVVCKTLL